MPSRAAINVAILMASLAGLGLLILLMTIGDSPPSPVEVEVKVSPNGESAETAFVGEKTCADCHADIASTYRNSAHAKTFHRSLDSEIAARLDGTSFDDSARNARFKYHFDKSGLFVTLPEKFGDKPFPLQYAIGSGKHAVTFLSLIPHENGETLGVEHRATYYESLNGLEVTPGQSDAGAPGQPVEHFGEFVVGRNLGRCVECHTTTGTIAQEQIHDLIPHVSCESCHGAGGEHVQRMQSQSVDPQMSVTNRWPAAIDEITTCGQCHRLPEMLQQTELRPDSVALVRLQPVGILQSACFLRSNGELRCSTCHDPHAATSTDTAAYEQVCRNCHQPLRDPVCPENGAVGCIECHMPGININRTVFHDHWIRVRTENDPAAAGENLEDETSHKGSTPQDDR